MSKLKLRPPCPMYETSSSLLWTLRVARLARIATRHRIGPPTYSSESGGLTMPIRRIALVLAACCAWSSSSCLLSQAPAPSQRMIAITIDDLPAGGANSMPASELLEMTNKLVTTLKEQKVPAVGFVNEQKLYKTGEVDDRIQSLNLWLDNGLGIGHTHFRPQA